MVTTAVVYKDKNLSCYTDIAELFSSPSFWLPAVKKLKYVDDVCMVSCYEAFNGQMKSREGDLQFDEICEHENIFYQW